MFSHRPIQWQIAANFMMKINRESIWYHKMCYYHFRNFSSILYFTFPQGISRHINIAQSYMHPSISVHPYGFCILQLGKVYLIVFVYQNDSSPLQGSYFLIPMHICLLYLGIRFFYYNKGSIYCSALNTNIDLTITYYIKSILTFGDQDNYTHTV